MSRRQPLHTTRRGLIFSILADHARTNRGLPSMRACYRLVSIELATMQEPPMSFSTFRGHWDKLRIDNLICIEPLFGTIAITPSELTVYMEDWE